MARIKIDLTNGVFEAEGDENFLKDLYEDFKKGLAENQTIKQLTDVDKGAGSNKSTTSGSSKKTGKLSSKRKESYSIVKDLDLSSKVGGESLRSVFDKKKPASGMERATVFVYYLQKINKTTGITPDHIYTCYKEVGIPVPKALKQSLLDTASRKGSIDTSDLSNITLTTVGENVVEYDLPAQKEGSL